MPLFIAATNVHTGRLRVFPREKIDADAVMASACLPYVFRAVEIDGVPYWDGGYIANPPIFPFFRTTDTEDVLVVQINPVRAARRRRRHRRRSSTASTRSRSTPRCSPNTAPSSSSRRLIDEGALQHGTGPGEYRRINVHRIDLGFVGKKLTPQSRLNTDFDFFEMLHRAGRRAGRRFLDRHFDDIGVRSTIDLREEMRAERRRGHAGRRGPAGALATLAASPRSATAAPAPPASPPRASGPPPRRSACRMPPATTARPPRRCSQAASSRCRATAPASAPCGSCR